METETRQPGGQWANLSRRSGTAKNDRLLTATFAAAGLLLVDLLGCRSTLPLTPQEEEGKHLYSVRCAHCHEDNDLGLKKKPPDLHQLFEHPALPSGASATD